MPTKRKDGRLQTSVTVENPITGEKKKVYVYGYDLSELEAEKYRTAASYSSVLMPDMAAK